MSDEKECKYKVLITGENTHFDIPINDLNDFSDLQNILEILKKRL